MHTQLVAIFILVILSAIFSTTETAYTSLSILQLKALESKKRKSADMAVKLAQNPDRLLTTVLIGNNVVNIVASSLTTTYTIALFGNTYVGIATGILTLAILIFAEITPKQLAMEHNTTIAMVMAYPIRFIMIVLLPIVWVISKISNGITRIFSKKDKTQTSVEGILHIMDVAETEGIIDEYETDLVERVLHFSETQVKTIMTHRTRVFSISQEQSLREAFPSIIESGFSRIPVYQESPENIVGILLVRSILKASLENHFDEPVSAFVMEPVFVPETRHIDDMFAQFRQEQIQMAIVLDEYGGLSGIITMEDIVEQLFGELYDEHETGEKDRIRACEQQEGSYYVQADTPFQQLVDEFDIDWKHADKVGTVAAYILELTGTIPQEGMHIESPLGSFEIIKMNDRRMEQIKFIPTPCVD